MNSVGITQPLNRLSYIASLGHLTKINSQFEKSRKISGPRSLQPSQCGMICPTDTPEGESCGLVKNLAITAHVTTEEDETVLRAIAIDFGVEDASLLAGDELYDKNTFMVFLNGSPLGVHSKPYLFAQNLRILKRKGFINEFVSVCVDETLNSINISADSGRITRPLLIVEDGKILFQPIHLEELVKGVRTYQDCVKEGLIE